MLKYFIIITNNNKYNNNINIVENRIEYEIIYKI